MIKAATILGEGYLHPSPLQGAVQTGVEETLKRFKKYSPYVFSSHMDTRPDIEEIDKVWHYRTRCGQFDKILFPFYSFSSPFFCYLHMVIRSIKELGIELVHVRNRPLYMPYLRKKLGNKVKLILHEHNQNIADTFSKRKAMEVLDSIDAYVAVSKFTFDYEISNKYPQYKGKSHVILNGVNLEKFRPRWERLDKVKALRDKYHLGNNKVILFAGAIRERKGIHCLVDAMKLVAKRHPEAKLVIAGGSAENLEATDPFAKKVRASSAEISENILWLGYIPPTEIDDIYLLADMFVGPSLWEEPFGLVFTEASASGLAVIGSRRGGIPEIIKENETGSLLDDPENIAEMANKINALLDSPAKCEQFGRSGRKYMEEMFSWDSVAKQNEDLYDKLLA